MKISATVQMNLRTGPVGDKVMQATKDGLRDITVKIARDVIAGSPVLTGHNRRSIQYTVKELEAMIYSTSGYGGFLETGTVKMAARPYFKPALDRNIGGLGGAIKGHLK